MSPTQPEPGVVDLLGLVGYGELSAFERLAADGAGAPLLADRVAIAALAGREQLHFEQIRAFLAERGVDLVTAMEPFHDPVDAFHQRTVPKTWLEGLVKTFVGGGFAADFQREVAGRLTDPAARDLIGSVLGDAEADDYIVQRVRDEITRTPSGAGRLALWARRVVGEALSQAQRIATDHPVLARTLTGLDSADSPETADPAELGEVQALFGRLTDNHSKRMARLGLQP